MATAIAKTPFSEDALVVDPAHDLYQYRSASDALDAIFAPKCVAVIGASERAGSVGRAVLWNLLSTPFGGTVYPVNGKRRNVLGIRAYPDVASLPERPDLAVIVTPANTVPGIIAECVRLAVPSAIVISAGFKEQGTEGKELEHQIQEHIQGGAMRVIGPNCLGVMNPLTGLNATFARSLARPGNVAFISQSGALCTAVLDWSLRAHVGFSAFVSIGSMLDVSLYETPVVAFDPSSDAATRASHVIADVLSRHRTLLTEFESKQILAAYGIPVVQTRLARTDDEAVGHADDVGYPVVLKLHSETVTHKTDVGGVAQPDHGGLSTRGLSSDRGIRRHEGGC